MALTLMPPIKQLTARQAISQVLITGCS